MRADERVIPTAGGAGEGGLPVTEAEQQMLASVHESIEGHHVGRRGEAVREAQGHPHAGALRGDR